jgi:hypothetical protein
MNIPALARFMVDQFRSAELARDWFTRRGLMWLAIGATTRGAAYLAAAKHLINMKG